MRSPRSLFSLTSTQLLAETRALLAAAAENTADLLAHLAEIDERKLYVPAAYPSLLAFCVGELRMAGDSAEKRIQTARAARRVPALLPASADGRLSVSAALLLGPHLTPENAHELIALAEPRACAEIRTLLARRSAQPAPARDPWASGAVNPGTQPDSNPVMSNASQPTPSPSACITAPASPAPPRRVLQFTVPAELADAYRDALALTPYEVAHDPALAFAHMLAAWRQKLEKRRCAATSSPGRRRGRARNARRTRSRPGVRSGAPGRGGRSGALPAAAGARRPRGDERGAAHGRLARVAARTEGAGCDPQPGTAKAWRARMNSPQALPSSSSSSVRGQSLFSRRESARSASSRPPVWQRAQ